MRTSHAPRVRHNYRIPIPTAGSDPGILSYLADSMPPVHDIVPVGSGTSKCHGDEFGSPGCMLEYRALNSKSIVSHELGMRWCVKQRDTARVSTGNRMTFEVGRVALRTKMHPSSEAHGGDVDGGPTEWFRQRAGEMPRLSARAWRNLPETPPQVQQPPS